MNKKKILKLAGAWKDAPEIDVIFNEIFEERHKTKERNIKV